MPSYQCRKPDFRPFESCCSKVTPCHDIWKLTRAPNQPLASIHFDGTFNFLDLFLPKPLSSADRARVFLWLMYYYLESPDTPNPFDDNYSREHPPKAPLLRTLSAAEMARENVDTGEEMEWGRMMSARRNQFLQKLVSAIENEKKAKPVAPHFVPGFSISSPHALTTS